MVRSGTSAVRPQQPAAFAGHLLALASSALAWRLLQAFHGSRFGEFAAEADAILEGRSFSPAFQNRLLGPWLLRSLSDLTGISRTQAFSVILFAFLACAHAVCFETLRRLWGGTAGALQATLLCCAAYILLTDSVWVKIWDAPDYLVFQLLAASILLRARTGWIAALFAVALTNRESALFIALWLVLSSIDWRSMTLSRWPRVAQPRVLVLGLVLGVVGAGTVVAIRRRLWLGSSAELPDLTASGNHFKFWDNLAWLRTSLGAPNPDLVVLGCVVLVFALLARRARRFSSAGIACTLLLGSMAVANLLFAQIDESRVWIACIPVVLATGSVGLEEAEPDGSGIR